MIANAQVTSTIAQLKSVDAAAGTFRDIYDSFPGDMVAAVNRLPANSCNAAVCVNGDGNGRLGATSLVGGGESANFFPHLQGAELVTNVNGTGYLDADVAGNEIVPGYTANGAALGLLGAPRAGHYLTISLTGTPGAVNLKPVDAARMDRKMDDGDPTTGSAGGVGGANCGAAGAYNEGSSASDCAFSVRIQG